MSMLMWSLPVMPMVVIVIVPCCRAGIPGSCGTIAMITARRRCAATSRIDLEWAWRVLVAVSYSASLRLKTSGPGNGAGMLA